MQTTLKISEIIDEWLESLDVMEQTKRDYRRKLAPWFTYLSSRKLNPRTPTRKHALDYKTYLLELGNSPSVVNAKVGMLRLFYGWCEDRNYYTSIAAGIRSIKNFGGYSKHPLTVNQATTLLESIEGDTMVARRDRLLVGLMLYNGLRTCEIFRINIEDFSKIEDQAVLYIQRKGRHSKSEYVVLHEDQVGALELYLSDRDFKTSDPLFISHQHPDAPLSRLTKQYISHSIKKRLRGAGIDDPKLTAHSLRHTYGTMLIESGCDLETVRDLMGHSSSNTTRIYVGLAQKRRLLHNSPTRSIHERIQASNGTIKPK